MASNTEFLNAYNRLDNYLQSIVHVPKNTNLISYLERVLPEQQRAECKTIREYKNTIESHGVSPGAVKPTVPKEWIQWLNNTLSYCKKNSNKIAKQIQAAYDSSKSNKKSRSGSSAAQSSPSLSTFAKEIRGDLRIHFEWGDKPYRLFCDILNAARRVISNYDRKKIEELQKQYECRIKYSRFSAGKRAEAINELAERMLTFLDEQELNYLLCGR